MKKKRVGVLFKKDLDLESKRREGRKEKMQKWEFLNHLFIIPFADTVWMVFVRRESLVSFVFWKRCLRSEISWYCSGYLGGGF